MLSAIGDWWVSDMAHDLRFSIGGFFIGVGVTTTWFRVRGWRLKQEE